MPLLECVKLILLDDTAKNVVPCPCNSPENCFSFDDNGIEICNCLPGYEQQVDIQGNETCTGMSYLFNHIIHITSMRT